MRQHITKQQWNELGWNEEGVIAEFFQSFDWNAKDQVLTITYPSIGQIIEYLGDDLDEIWLKDGIAWRVRLNNKDEWFRDEELIDALWEAVKYKLRNTTT